MSLPVYPAIPMDRVSRITGVRSGRSTVVTMEGNIAQTVSHPNEKLNYRLSHTLQHAEHWQALEAFYAANKYTRFEANLDGVTRAWEFVEKPLYTEPYRFIRQYTVDLREV